jgi:hypothetical protein
VQGEALGFDRARAAVDARGDMNLESCLARGASHRQAIKQEGPILVGDVEQSSGWPGFRWYIHSKFRNSARWRDQLADEMPRAALVWRL